jgi:PfaD family protein
MISNPGLFESGFSADTRPPHAIRRTLGWWYPDTLPPLTGWESIREAILQFSQTHLLIQTQDGLAIAIRGSASFTPQVNGQEGYPIVGLLPPIQISSLGDPGFCLKHGLRYPYVTGSMANGIASVEIVEAISRAGMLGFFGAAGLSLPRIEESILRLKQSLGGAPFGLNLIHSPAEPLHERETVELYLKHSIRLIEASAYLDLTLPVIRYRLAGIHRGRDGEIVVPNRILAKVSRIEVASKFFAPPPEKFVRELQAQGHLSTEQVELSKQIPVAEEITVEADSGGHTDNRPLVTLLPTILALRDRMQSQYDRSITLRVGAAGGISTPASAAAAFAMGAAFVVTGSVNQACVESGSSDSVREMLAQAEQADVTMAPAADMFEMGVKLQVLKRGTMFPMRAQKLYDLYRAYPNLQAIPASERTSLETQLFRQPLEQIWQQTRDYFQQRDPSQIQRAEQDAKHQMALVFRWYLGQSSRWANAGVPDRKIDYQIWCGPAMGAFNEWTRGSFLADFRNRDVVTVALNLLYGCMIALRQQSLRSQGVELPQSPFESRPLTRAVLEERLRLAEE